MSGGEEVKKKAIEVAEVAPEAVKKEQEGPVITKAQFAKQQQQDAQRRKAAANELTSYKKRLRDSNELKELQVAELELNIAYYKNKKEWFDLIPAVEELDAQEQAMIQKQKEEGEEKHRKELERRAEEARIKNQEELDAKDKEEKPKIIVPKTGKPRE